MKKLMLEEKNEMKRQILLVIGVIILLCGFLYYKNSNPKIIISSLVKKGGIKAGDLKYRINLFGVIPVAEAVFSLEKIEEYKGAKVYHLNALAGPLEIYAKLFKGYAALDSYVDISTLAPRLFKQRLESPGKENPSKEIYYDQKNCTMSMAGIARQIFPNTQDPLSAMFNLRRMDFDKVKEIEMSINTNQKNYILNGTAEQKDLSINNKIYKIIFIKAQVHRRGKNDPYHKTSITMQLLKGKDNIPLSIRVFTMGFLLNIRLIEIK